MVDLLADTYALFAVLDGSRAYRKHLHGQIATTALNVVELSYGLLRRGHADIQDLIAPFLDIVIEPPASVIPAAARFKAARHEAGARCSFVDAWGYETARHLGVPFLTGDEDFRGVPGVRFVKA